MALLDLGQDRIIIRIVYDGLEFAGKTTNLRQLCSFFTPMRRGELYTPEEQDGRTLYFDWLQLEGGLVNGQRLRCELITVPGQAVYAERRRKLLESADAVIFVWGSERETLELARTRVTEVRESTRGLDGGPVPLVLQANKQDEGLPLTLPEIAATFGLDTASVVMARANEGVGVRETAVMAIRAVAAALQTHLVRHGRDVLVGTAERPEALYERMREERRPALALAAAAPTSTAPTPAVMLQEAETRKPALVHASNNELPPLPDDSALSGLVWPAVRGRETLRHIMRERAELRAELAAQNGGAEGSGKSDTFVFRCGDWCVKTSRRRRFDDLDEGRNALLGLARTKLALDTLLLPGTTATLQRDAHDGYWLWTIAPWVTTLRGEMVRAAGVIDQPALAGALLAFADAAVESIVLAATRGLALDVHPSNFALVDGHLAYLDDDVDRAWQLPAIGHSILRRVDEYCAFEAAIDGYVAHLATRLRELGEIREPLREIFIATIPRTSPGQAARTMLLEALAARATGAGRMR